MRGEIGAGDQLRVLVADPLVVRAVVVRHGVVDRLLGQLGMEFARLAVGPRPVVVVDAVGQVRRLLDLGDESAGADAVDTPRRQEKDVARSDGMVAQQVADRMVGYRRGIGFGIHAAVETDTQTGAARLRNDVPHLGLAVHPVTLPRQTVVGVYLNREILAGVDEFDQQRKFVAETFVIALSHQFGAVAVDQLRQGNTLAGPLGDDRFVSGDARQLPALADRPHRGLNALVGGDLLAAPDHGTQERFEFQRIHDIYRFCKILFLPELPSTQSKRLLYLLGVQPTMFLKSLVKCAGYLNPSS